MDDTNKSDEISSLTPDFGETSAPHTETPLHYEETPIIDPVPEPPKKDMPFPYPPEKRQSSSGNFLKAIIGFIILFIIGYVASGYIRQYISTIPIGGGTPQIPSPTGMPEEMVSPFILPSGAVSTPSSGMQSGWKTYQVINGMTKQAVEGLSFQLPATVLSPICDGTTCASQGTYLPGGTRFTVAPRGTGQVLSDYRNKIISDLTGKAFTVKETTLAGQKAVEFSGTFTGSTVGGYAFSRMHGYMIELSGSTSLEINHFTPSGITADFEADDAVFAQIVKTLTLPGVEKGSLLLVPSVTLRPLTTPTVKPINTLVPSATQSSGF